MPTLLGVFQKFSIRLFGLMPILGDYCLLAVHKEHTIERNFLLDMSSKQPLSPQIVTGGEVKKGAHSELERVQC
jgi:hypothetical protein